MVNKILMKVKDFQFPRFFLLNEVSLDRSLIASILETNIEIHTEGPVDYLEKKDGLLVFSNPSSVTRFLFHILYSVLSGHITNNIQKDKAALGLLFACKNYVYSDFDTKQHSGPPVLIKYNKLPVPFFIIKEIIEPIVGKIDELSVLFSPCKFTDSARVIKTQQLLKEQYNVPTSFPYNDFPLVLVNCDIHNSASQLSHLVSLLLKHTLGEDKFHDIMKTILTDQSSDLMPLLIQSLKMLKDDPTFVVDFLDYLGCCINMTTKERNISQGIQKENILSDNYLNKYIKVAAEKNTPGPMKQWSQWSMLMGLIEKQLGPMRGSMWPTTENMEPYENRFKQLLIQKRKDNKKSRLNFEEMLEGYRDLYDHNAIEPGQLIENLLKDNRVWKM